MDVGARRLSAHPHRPPEWRSPARPHRGVHPLQRQHPPGPAQLRRGGPGPRRHLGHGRHRARPVPRPSPTRPVRPSPGCGRAPHRRRRQPRRARRWPQAVVLAHRHRFVERCQCPLVRPGDRVGARGLRGLGCPDTDTDTGSDTGTHSGPGSDTGSDSDTSAIAATGHRARLRRRRPRRTGGVAALDRHLACARPLDERGHAAPVRHPGRRAGSGRLRRRRPAGPHRVASRHGYLALDHHGRRPPVGDTGGRSRAGRL